MSDTVVTLPRSVAAWNGPVKSPTFRATLIEKTESLGADHTVLQPLLQSGLTQSRKAAQKAGPQATVLLAVLQNQQTSVS